MIHILLPLLVAVIGVLTYALASNAKLVRIGEILFGCGILVSLFVVATKVIKF